MGLEPVINAGNDNAVGRKKHDKNRYEGNGDEREYQTGTQACPENLPLSFQKEFHYAAGNQKEHYQHQDNIDVEQNKEKPGVSFQIGKLPP